MQIKDIALESFRIVRAQRGLWLFGFFVMAGSVSFNFSSDEGQPSWLGPVLVGLGVLSVALFVLRVLSESALIEGVRRTRRGETLSIRDGFESGARNFKRMLGLQLTTVAAAALVAVPVAAPIALAIQGVISPLMGVVIAVPLALLATPLLVTLYFVFTYACRFVVIGERPVMDALAEGKRFLAGRIVSSMKLVLADVIGGLGIQLVALPAILVVLGIGLALYFSVGLVPALVVGGVLASPIAIAINSATGTYRSSLWTIAFLDEHPALA